MCRWVGLVAAFVVCDFVGVVVAGCGFVVECVQVGLFVCCSCDCGFVGVVVVVTGGGICRCWSCSSWRLASKRPHGGDMSHYLGTHTCFFGRFLDKVLEAKRAVGIPRLRNVCPKTNKK